MATYAGHMTLNLIPMMARQSSDMIDNPTTFFRDGWVKFAPRADMMEVQRAHNVLLSTYADAIDPSACRDPVVKFTSSIGGDNVAWYTPANENSPAVIELRTYLPNLGITAAHEFLHCYTHPDFIESIDRELNPFHGRDIREGLTEVMARRLKLPRPDPLEFKSIYPKQVKMAEAVLKDAGEDTVRRAMLSGDGDAIGKIVDAARKQLA